MEISITIKIGQKIFFQLNKKSEIQEGKYVVKTNIFAAVTMLFSIFPIVFLIIYLAIFNKDNISLLSMLIVTLPRQMMSIQFLSLFVEHLMNMSGITARVADLQIKIKFKINPNELKGTITWGKIRIETKNDTYFPKTISDIQQITNNFRPGRFTLKGSNGAGKTVLLVAIKEQLKDSSYYLPTSSNLYFKSIVDVDYSVGQKLIAEIKELTQSRFYKQLQVLLLDEWDANLDYKNKQKISLLIDKIAQDKCILESRHNYHKKSLTGLTQE